MFFTTYKFILGEKSTISSTALDIFFNNYYKSSANLLSDKFFIGSKN
jgi:hypothetical protein